MEKEIRQLGAEELEEALVLAWKTFLCDCAREYTQEGVEDFYKSIEYEFILHRMGDGVLRCWGAFDKGVLVGMCMMRELCHIELLFVSSAYQGQGAGKHLLKKVILDCKNADTELNRITVNAMPMGQGFFEAMGFTHEGKYHTIDGIPLLPMVLQGRVE